MAIMIDLPDRFNARGCDPMVFLLQAHPSIEHVPDMTLTEIIS